MQNYIEETARLVVKVGPYGNIEELNAKAQEIIRNIDRDIERLQDQREIVTKVVAMAMVQPRVEPQDNLSEAQTDEEFPEPTEDTPEAPSESPSVSYAIPPAGPQTKLAATIRAIQEQPDSEILDDMVIAETVGVSTATVELARRVIKTGFAPLYLNKRLSGVDIQTALRVDLSIEATLLRKRLGDEKWNSQISDILSRMLEGLPVTPYPVGLVDIASTILEAQRGKANAKRIIKGTTDPIRILESLKGMTPQKRTPKPGIQSCDRCNGTLRPDGDDLKCINCGNVIYDN